MPRARRFHNTFVTGQVSQTLHERYDFEKREGALAIARNVRIRPQGGLVRRDGSRFVAQQKDNTDRIRLIPFVFSRTQAYILEFGEQYIRFYRDGGQLVDGAGFPVEVTTPWSISEVQDFDFTQDADTLVIFETSTQTRLLQRWSDTNWTLSNQIFRPPPTREEGLSDANTTLSLTLISGNRFTVLITVGGSRFNEGDIGRVLTEQGEGATGYGVIDTFTSGTQVEMTVVESFSKSTLSVDPNGGSEWLLEGSPLTSLAVVKTSDGKDANGTQGELVTLLPYIRDRSSANLLSNSDFSSSLTSWDDYSGSAITSGTHSGGTGDNFLQHSTDLTAAGAELNHLITNDDAGRQYTGNIARFTSNGSVDNSRAIPDDTETIWDNGDAFTVKETSYVLTDSDGAHLHAGKNGTAWIEQDIPAIAQTVYEYEITVRDFPVQFQIGSSSKTSDIVDEVTLQPGVTTVVFKTPGASGNITMYVQLRNNQPETVPIVELVTIKLLSTGAFISSAVPGDWVRVSDGYVNLLDVGDTLRPEGVVQKVLSTMDDAFPGEWSIEKSRFSGGVWPGYGAFFQGRLWPSSLLTVWGSRTDNIRDFGFGPNDGDAIEFEPAATEINNIHWIIGTEVLLLGTRNEVYLVSGTETSFITPSDIDVSSPVAVGSEAVKPVRVGNAILFVKAGGKRIIELDQRKREQPDRDLSVLAHDLISGSDRISQIAWQDEPHQTLWCVTNNRFLYSLTYVKEHNVYAWARHDAPLTPLWESVAVIPHPDGDRDQVWVSCRRAGQSKAEIAYFEDDGSLIPSYSTLTTDGTIRYDGASTTTLSGLNHLTGNEVYVVDTIGIQGPYAVVAGTITIDRAVTKADIGVGPTVEIETLRPDIEGEGPTGLRLADANVYIRLRNTGDGVTVRGKTVPMRLPSDPMDGYITPFTGEKEVSSSGFSRDLTVNITQSLPAPFELQSIAGTIIYESP